MKGIRRIRSSVLGTAACSAMLLLYGCVTPAPVYDPPPAEPVVDITPLPDDSIVQHMPEPEPVFVPPPVRVVPAVTIVLTSRDAAYADVATELGKHFEKFTIFDLSDKSETPVVTFRSINDSDSQAVIAIGLRAAQSSVSMAQAPVIFSQVFNYQDHDLLTARSRGIAALPPLEAHIAAWKQIDPSLNRIGVIIGQGHEDLIAEAEIAAEKHGVQLELRTVNSDRETLYYFNRMIRDIDGFWLFPDNRILSGAVLQKMLAEANRLHVPVAVPNESILAMGATISFSAVAADIAAAIVNVVGLIGAGEIDQVPPISELSEIRVVTNESQLRRSIKADAAAANNETRSTLQ